MMGNTNNDYIDYCISEAVTVLKYYYYDYPRDENSISNAIMVISDSFHTEVIKDELNYALWYQQQQQPNDNDINIEMLCNMQQITQADFIKLYLLMIKDMGYGNTVLIKCLQIDCDENPHLYTQEFLKVIDDEYLFRYLKDFIN